MTHDRFTRADPQLTEALRALYAAPTDDSYWTELESRIARRVAARDEDGAHWYVELADMMRPGLVAAAAIILALSLAVARSSQTEARNAYASVINPTPSSIDQSARGASAADGDAAIHFLLSH